jgi:YD repeat-containing protein
MYAGTSYTLYSTPQSLTCSPFSTGYLYDFPQLLNPYSSGQWTSNGTVSAATGLFTSSATNGGSLMLNSMALGNKYEVKTSLQLVQGSNGGNYITYLGATTNSLKASGNTGTFYAVEVANPTWSGSTCSANLNMYSQAGAGTLTLLASGAISCHNGMVVRSVLTPFNSIIVYVDNVYRSQIGGVSVTTGQPGVGVAAAPSGTGISAIDIGHIDLTPPGTINPSTIAVTALPNRVDFQFQGVMDDSNGIGMSVYTLARNSVWAGGSPASQAGFSDPNVTAGSSYTYTLYAGDYHLQASNTSITVDVPSSGIDPRQVGVRPTGSYYGGAGEQIDLRSGNLNYTLPLLKPQARGGWSVGINLSYNSQNWAKSTHSTWQYGRDVGYGYGWRLQAGSLTPVYADYWNMHHYLFVDSTGAEYRLDQNNGGVWSSKEGIYVYFDSFTGRLYFKDGSFWVMGCVSAGTEQDAGTMYPTVMQDTNGNQIILTYNPGLGIGPSNSSARIKTIEDVRHSGAADYTFTYNGDPIPHLTSISTFVQSSENYTFVYSSSASVLSPFDGTNYGTFQNLHTSTVTGQSLTTTFNYNSSGEMTSVNTPLVGALRWGYINSSVSSSRTFREVQDRFFTQMSGATETGVSIYRDPGDTGRSVHLYANLFDWSGGANKVWWFETNTSLFNAGLLTAYEERNYPSGVALFPQDNTWSQAPTSANPYISATLTTLDPGQTYQAVKNATQDVDQYGNLLHQYVYDFGNLSTPARTYTSRYIFNRLLTSSVTDAAGKTATPVSNTYDGGTLTYLSATEHDSFMDTSQVYRGNVTASSTSTATKTTAYDMTGNATSATTNGVTTSASITSATNYSLPSQITAGTLSSTFGYNALLSLSSQTGPNTDNSTITYDSYLRPLFSTSPYGATSAYAYYNSASPPYRLVITNYHWERSTLDGFGRTVKTETGISPTTSPATSISETLYAPCGCSPLGKVFAQSQPYASSPTNKFWTVYAYDGSGRTLSKSSADFAYSPTAIPTASNAASKTTYVYQGNTVTVTDPAGKWKKFTTDAFGNLTSVVEPDPALGNVTTTYAYDVLNHLTAVSMPRGSNTQTRTFAYNSGSAVGGFLLSATNPENGTVTYTYSSGRVASKTDAKGQQFTYQYDSLGRLTSVTWANAPGGAKVLRTNSYDTNPLDATFSNNAQGRLTTVQYANVAGQVRLIDMYSYTVAGLPTTKRLQVNEDVTWPGHMATASANLDVTYSYDSEGRTTAVTYPSTSAGAGIGYTYSYDFLERLTGMTDSSSSTIVGGVTYGAGNEFAGHELRWRH